jgi:methylphosphotriester-DNA--protein-cysteine methyltransferase
MTPKPATPCVADDPRWARIVARDKTADGHLWYSVSTTGVYCRPSCPSRVANPGNVQLHVTLEDAKATGFRPCRRCNPDGPSIESENATLVARACRIIEQSEEVPSLAGLADAIGRSPSYFHRIFKAVIGLTPKDYAAAHRAKKVRQGLAYGNTVTATIYEAGFNSSGRFYEKATDILGMTPSRYRAGGTNEEIRFAVGQSSLGAILVASSRKAFQKPISSGPIATTKPWLRGLSAWLRRRASAWIFPWTSAAPLSSNACGRLYRKFPSAKRFPMPRSPGVLVPRTPRAPSPELAPQTISPSPFPATAWFARTGRFRDTPGAPNASASCWTANDAPAPC